MYFYALYTYVVLSHIGKGFEKDVFQEVPQKAADCLPSHPRKAASLAATGCLRSAPTALRTLGRARGNTTGRW